MYKVQRYKRGQVWMADLYIDRNQNCHIQGGKRPVLIFSSDEGNLKNNFVTAIALTSQIKTPLPINIEFVQEDGMTKNTILCNQVFCLSKTKLLSYMFTIPDELMHEVEKAFNTAHSIPNSSEYIETNIEQMKDAIKDIHVLAEDSYIKESDAQKALIEIASEIRTISQDLKARWHAIVDKATNPDIHENKIDPIDEYNSRQRTGCNPFVKNKTKEVNTNKTEDKSVKPKYIKSTTESTSKRSKSGMPRGYWSNVDNIRNFIKDKEVLSIDELTAKYKFENPDKCMKAYHNCKWKLKQYENKQAK